MKSMVLTVTRLHAQKNVVRTSGAMVPSMKAIENLVWQSHFGVVKAIS